MRDKFYLILPSNSSMKYYPDNTVTHFVTQLPHSIKLPGEWVVALTEIQFPCSFMHFSSKDAKIKVAQHFKTTLDPESHRRDFEADRARGVMPLQRILSPEKFEHNMKIGLESLMTLTKPDSKPEENFSIPQGNYTSINALINTIYEDPAFDDHIKIKYNNDTGGIVNIECDVVNCISIGCLQTHELHLSGKLSRVFGFESNNPIMVRRNENVLANFPASMSQAIPDKLFVYTDICENYITGDIQTPLLRIVSIDNMNYTYGSVQTKSFSLPNYIPLLRTEFETIDIDIRTHTGEPVPFESGTLTVTLHFKRVR